MNAVGQTVSPPDYIIRILSLFTGLKVRLAVHCLNSFFSPKDSFLARLILIFVTANEN
jgi:hypothetical protein